MRHATLVAIIGLGVGCGDDVARRCSVEHFAGSFGERLNPAPENCLAALRFVARDTSTITASQDEGDRYFERWSRVVAAEPILTNRLPQKYRATSSSLVASILTTNASVIAAFAQPTTLPAQLFPTGDAAFDQIMSELVRPQLRHQGVDHGDGEISFDVASSADFNEELLHARLLTASSRLVDPYVAYNDDGVWTWPELGPGSGADDATAQIDFSFGWGDCFVSCQGMHDLRAIVPPTGPAIVYDMGGDPLPPNLVLAPTTLPPP